ncbi:hypothetical protein [Alloyangia pacifica]|uniref:hypothetical protein n=1 Tax=Alloyangia pacifica TaxID=311180 RepID=UPI001CD60B02|nr:hypothetical protein [Alloyangia pacifica]MCA0996176.1 hypothetical protein [Alloyangia pacifica]
MQPHSQQAVDDMPSPTQILRALWRRIQETNDTEILIELIREAAKWVDIVESELAPQKSLNESPE